MLRRLLKLYCLTELKNHPNWKLLDRADDCGHNVADRIIGGEKASLGQYPWISRIGYTLGDYPESIGVDMYECGGTIINNRYILTAAHCSSAALSMKMVEVRLGEHDARTEKDCVNGVCAPPVQDIEVESEICHSGYTKQTYQNDICLIRLAKPIKFNAYVNPICLPAFDTLQNQNFEGAIMEVAGWGVMDIHTQRPSDVLLTLKVPVVSHYLCTLTYSGRAEIIPQQICAGGVIGKDSCSGDSGGPLMKPFSINGPPRYFIVGVVSFGPQKCADSETPGVYTLVSQYFKWILDNIHA